MAETGDILTDAAGQSLAALANGCPVHKADVKRRLIFAINVLAAELAELESGCRE